MLYQLIVMFGCALAGQIISAVLPFPFPGTIIAAVILFLLLETGLVKIEKIKTISEISNKYLSIFFIPVGVAIMQYFGDFAPIVWVKIILVIIITTALTMGITGKISDLVMAIEDKRRGEEDAK